MALQFSTTYRNALLTQLSTTMGGTEVLKMFTGSPPANCGTGDSGTLLVTYTLAGSGDWAAASAGAMSLASLPLTTTAGNTGTMGYFRGYDSGAVCHIQGTVTATGGGGDLTFDNPALASGQTVNLNTFTLTAPGV